MKKTILTLSLFIFLAPTSIFPMDSMDIIDGDSCYNNIDSRTTSIFRDLTENELNHPFKDANELHSPFKDEFNKHHLDQNNIEYYEKRIETIMIIDTYNKKVNNTSKKQNRSNITTTQCLSTQYLKNKNLELEQKINDYKQSLQNRKKEMYKKWANTNFSPYSKPFCLLD